VSGPEGGGEIFLTSIIATNQHGKSRGSSGEDGKPSLEKNSIRTWADRSMTLRGGGGHTLWAERLRGKGQSVVQLSRRTASRKGSLIKIHFRYKNVQWGGAYALPYSKRKRGDFGGEKTTQKQSFGKWSTDRGKKEGSLVKWSHIKRWSKEKVSEGEITV